MSFLKFKQIGNTSLILCLLLASCASRGPGYAARVELYDKLVQSQKNSQPERIDRPGVVEKVAVAREEVIPEASVVVEPVFSEPEVVSAPPKAVRTITSNPIVEAPKVSKVKKAKSYSKVIVDELDLNIVPATSSPSGQGYLLND